MSLNVLCPSRSIKSHCESQPSATGSRLDRCSQNYSEFGTAAKFLQTPYKRMWNQEDTIRCLIATWPLVLHTVLSLQGSQRFIQPPLKCFINLMDVRRHQQKLQKCSSWSLSLHFCWFYFWSVNLQVFFLPEQARPFAKPPKYLVSAW